MPAAGGTARTVCAAPGGENGAWSASGTIVFSRGSAGLFAVPAAGGEIKQITVVNKESGETGHLAPEFLPDGRHVLFLADADVTSHAVWVADVEGGGRERLIEDVPSRTVFADGHLLYNRHGAIRARRFDPTRRVFTGSEFPIVDDVRDDHARSFAAAPNGVLAYWPADARLTRLTWYDDEGRAGGTVGVAGEYEAPSIAPDGRLVAVTRFDRGADNRDIWILEREGEKGRQLTREPSIEDSPVWSPDGRTIAFASNRTGPFTIFTMGADGAEDARSLGVPAVDVMPMQWGARRGLVFLLRQPGQEEWDIWIKPSETAPAAAWRPTPTWEGAASASPDGRWMAYLSSEGENAHELFIRPVSGSPAVVIRAAPRGARQPVWSRDGSALFYVSADDQMVRVPVNPVTHAPDAAAARILFKLPPLPPHHRIYDVASDGRFLVNTLVTTTTPGAIAVTNRWAVRSDRE